MGDRQADGSARGPGSAFAAAAWAGAAFVMLSWPQEGWTWWVAGTLLCAGAAAHWRAWRRRRRARIVDDYER